jgi:hypothetical protein
MGLYEMRATPTWILIDKQGELQVHIFGKIEELLLGAEIARLAREKNPLANIYKNKRE